MLISYRLCRFYQLLLGVYHSTYSSLPLCAYAYSRWYKGPSPPPLIPHWYGNYHKIHSKHPWVFNCVLPWKSGHWVLAIWTALPHEIWCDSKCCALHIIWHSWSEGSHKLEALFEVLLVVGMSSQCLFSDCCSWSSGVTKTSSWLISAFHPSLQPHCFYSPDFFSSFHAILYTGRLL